MRPQYSNAFYISKNANGSEVLITFTQQYAERECDKMVPKAEDIANDIVDAIKTGASKEDVADLVATLEKYINDKGIGSDEIKDPGALRDIADAFLTDAGVDVEALNNAISNSIIANKALELYYKPENETTTEPETPTEEPEPEIPACGFVG